MKIRNGFVSNSSSSSFVICKRDLTPEKLKKVKEWFDKVGDPNDSEYCDDTYYTDTGKHLMGSISYHCNFEDVMHELGVDWESNE